VPASDRQSTSTRQWVIRIVGALAMAGGLTITLIGATPGILGGWGTIGLMVPGMLIATGGFIAIIETTPLARSRRR
jgi:preprotein translocase subunit SecY